MASPSPHHRHQSSLKRIPDFSPQTQLLADQHVQAQSLFYCIIDHFSTPDDKFYSQYKRPLLIRYTYEYTRSETSRDRFLRAFFDSMGLDIAREELNSINWSDKDLEDKLRSNLIEFSDFLLDNFFLPSSSKRTPQSSPKPLKEHLAERRTILGLQTGYQSFGLIAFFVTAIVVWYHTNSMQRKQQCVLWKTEMLKTRKGMLSLGSR